MQCKPAIHLSAWLLISWQCYGAKQPLIAKTLSKDYKRKQESKQLTGLIIFIMVILRYLMYLFWYCFM